LLQTFAKRFNAQGRTVVFENSDDLINPLVASVAATIGEAVNKRAHYLGGLT